MKRLHYCQHVPFEGLGSIATWAEAAGFQISGTRFYRNDPLPIVDELEWLVIMGGPMNIYEEAQDKWQLATDHWIELTLEKYKGYDIDDLTQVFMRGPFAGWSERMVLELAMGMDDANTKVPRHKIK